PDYRGHRRRPGDDAGACAGRKYEPSLTGIPSSRCNPRAARDKEVGRSRAQDLLFEMEADMKNWKVALALGAGLMLASIPAQGIGALQPGAKAPDFTLRAAQGGRSFNLSLKQ